MKTDVLKSHIKQIRGVSYKSGQSLNEPTEGYLPVLRSNNIEESALNFDNLVYVPSELVKDEQKLKKGDILITASTGSIKVIGKNSYVSEDYNGSFGAFCKVVRPLDTVVPEFLKHYFQSNNYRSYIRSVVNGANINNIKTGHIDDLKIPLPPLEQQKQIANILDTADTYRQKTKALINKHDELTQSLFLDMFGDPVTNPMGWEEFLLSEVCDKITDGTHHSPEPQNFGIPYVTAKHVKPFHLDFESKPSYVSEEAHSEIYKRCTPEYGDVLYIKDGATTGIACINTFNEPISMLSSLALLKLGININNRYLCHWLNHEGIKQKLISQFMSGAAIKRYTLKKINSFKLMVPPVELQNQFAELAKAIEAQKTLAQSELDKSDELFNSLLQKAFKGELA